MAAAVARLDEVLAEIVAHHQGVRPVEQGEGDSFVVAFARASDAVACALALQLAPLAPLRLRVGVHTGEVQLRDEGNYMGPTINRTARLRDLAHGGQTVLSGVTYEMVAERLPDGVWVRELGIHTLGTYRGPSEWFSSAIQICATSFRRFGLRKPLQCKIFRCSSPALSDVTRRWPTLAGFST
jgi:class 3 adenylate cyclase